MSEEPVQEMIRRLAERIRYEEMTAQVDCRRYEDEARQRSEDRMRRLHDETADMRRQLDSIISTTAYIEMPKPVHVHLEKPGE